MGEFVRGSDQDTARRSGAAKKGQPSRRFYNGGVRNGTRMSQWSETRDPRSEHFGVIVQYNFGPMQQPIYPTICQDCWASLEREPTSVSMDALGRIILYCKNGHRQP